MTTRHDIVYTVIPAGHNSASAITVYTYNNNRRVSMLVGNTNITLTRQDAADLLNNARQSRSATIRRGTPFWCVDTSRCGHATAIRH